MSGFNKLEGEFAVTVSNGIYKQVDVYERNGYLYVQQGSGFIQVNHTGGTTSPKVRLDELNIETPIAMSKLGRLCIKGHAGIPEQRPVEGDKPFLTRAALPDGKTPKLA